MAKRQSLFWGGVQHANASLTQACSMLKNTTVDQPEAFAEDTLLAYSKGILSGREAHAVSD